MEYVPINIDLVKEQFPYIFRVFGSKFIKQIKVFNSVVEQNRFSRDEGFSVYFSMKRRKIKVPHTPILNIFSDLSRGDYFNRVVAWIYLLEKYLSDSPRGRVTLYREMLKSPFSFYSLIACFRQGQLAV